MSPNRSETEIVGAVLTAVDFNLLVYNNHDDVVASRHIEVDEIVAVQRGRCTAIEIVDATPEGRPPGDDPMYRRLRLSGGPVIDHLWDTVQPGSTIVTDIPFRNMQESNTRYEVHSDFGDTDPMDAPMDADSRHFLVIIATEQMRAGTTILLQRQARA